jgi:putative nucleotidyltransferase with HDIG domain
MNTLLVGLGQVAARVISEPRPKRTGEQSAGARVPGHPAAGYGARFGEALAFLQRPPVLAESRLRLSRAMEQRHAALGDAIEIVETDLGLATALLSAANRADVRSGDGAASVPGALAALGTRGTLRVAESLPVLRPAAPGDRMSIALARITAHSIAARAAAEYLAQAVGERDRDELRLAAALHDVGKVALVALRDGYMSERSDHSATPEARIADERRRLTIDHATIGAVTLRRLGAPKPLVRLVDRHHADDATGGAAIIRLADLLAHMASGDPVSLEAMTTLGRRLSLSEDDLHAIVYDLQRTPVARSLASAPSPLTRMQEKALRGLADGKRYKQIAADLGLAESTVRSHVHNLYRRLGVADRAHAVLLASERGWI